MCQSVTVHSYTDLSWAEVRPTELVVVDASMASVSVPMTTESIPVVGPCEDDERAKSMLWVPLVTSCTSAL